MGRTAETARAKTRVAETAAFMRILLLHVRAGMCPRHVGSARDEAGVRWRADLDAAANGGQAVGEELQPEGKSSGEEGAAQYCYEVDCRGRY